MFFVLQFATVAILILAANTAYADFPRLSSIIARDGYLPRQLANRGDRLVFSNGVIVPRRAWPALLIVAFGGITNALIPLYAVGVFTVVHAVAVRHGAPPPEGAGAGLAARARSINAVGAVATLRRARSSSWSSKFTERRLDPGRRDPDDRPRSSGRSTGTTMRVARALERARRLPVRARIATRSSCSSAACTGACSRRSPTPSRCAPTAWSRCRVVHDEEEQERITDQWEEFDIHVELETLYSPYRELTAPGACASSTSSTTSGPTTSSPS